MLSSHACCVLFTPQNTVLNVFFFLGQRGEAENIQNTDEGSDTMVL
jgi:hypothetical protein